MKQKIKFELYEGVEVPVSPLLKRQRSSRYGHIQELDDEELIDPAEIDRLYLREAFAPILALPVKAKKGGIRPNVNEDGTVDWGAFGTVDFDRYTDFDKARYKADKLAEELENERLMMEMISSKIKDYAKYKVIKYVEAGILDAGDISDLNMYCLTQRYLRAKRLQREIAELEQKSREKQEQRTRKILGS